jgi:hypothetical protein
MAFAATYQAVVTGVNSNAFNCHKNRYDAIHSGEYAFSRSLLDNGMNIDSLLLKYGRVDWRDKQNWLCNNETHPTRKGTYGNGMTVHPLEQVFYKPIWIMSGHATDDGKLISEAYLSDSFAYLEWALERKITDEEPGHKYRFIA